MPRQKRNNKSSATSGFNNQPKIQFKNSSPPINGPHTPYLLYGPNGDIAFNTYPSSFQQSSIPNSPLNNTTQTQKSVKNTPSKHNQSNGGEVNSVWTAQPAFDYEPLRFANGQPRRFELANGTPSSPILYYNRPSLEVRKFEIIFNDPNSLLAAKNTFFFFNFPVPCKKVRDSLPSTLFTLRLIRSGNSGGNSFRSTIGALV